MTADIRAHDDLPLPARTTQEQRSAAVRAVLWRVEHGQLDASQAHQALDALGLLPDGATDGSTDTEVPW